MNKPIASLSLDLDNKWAYLRAHGIESWRNYPTYLDVVLPRIMRFCAERRLRITCFVVGRDAQRPENHDALTALAAANHEIANHSLNHYPWLHTLGREQVEAEICEAEEHIERATGQRPIGFRGPGYSLSHHVLNILAQRGYLYDATTLPTYIGPLARWYFRRTASPEAADLASKREILGTFRDGLLPIKPHVRQTNSGPIVEIPVTTFPLIRLPIHTTYLLYLWRFSPRLTSAYLRLALTACRLLGVRPSILLHPLDFLGREDEPDLSFFPGMTLPRDEKHRLLHELMTTLIGNFRVVPLHELAEQAVPNLGIKKQPRASSTVDESRVAEPSTSS